MVKQLLYLSLVASVTLSVSAQRQSRYINRQFHAPVMNSQPLPHMWRAQHEKTYEWDGKWLLTEEHNNSYTSEGFISTSILAVYDEYEQLQGYSRDTYTYDAHPRFYTRKLTESSADKINWSNVQLVTREYDEKVPSLIINNSDYAWNGDWVKSGNNYIRRITRNEQGNITLCEVAVLYMGGYDVTDRLILTYGDDGKAAMIEHQTLVPAQEGGFEFVTDAIYKDIIWAETDGQITNVFDLPTESNRMSSCLVLMANGTYGQLSFSYQDEQGSFVSNLVHTVNNLPTRNTVEQKILDPNGSYERVETETSGIGALTSVYKRTEKIYFDELDLPTLQYLSETENGVEQILTNIIGEIEYHPEFGYPVVYTQKEHDVYAGEDFNIMRVEYYDYIDVLGVEDVTTAPEDAPVEYFDLNGRRIADPSAPGIYIRRCGTQVTKIAI